MELRAQHWLLAWLLAGSAHVALAWLLYEPAPAEQVVETSLWLALGGGSGAPGAEGGAEALAAVAGEPEAVEPVTAEPVEADVVEAEVVEPVEAAAEVVAVAEEPPPTPLPKPKPTPPKKAKPKPASAPPVAQTRPPAKTKPTASASPAATATTAAPAATASTGGQSGTAAARAQAGSGTAAASGGDKATLNRYYAELSAWLERHKQYPPRARSRRLEGTVKLRFVLDRNGRVVAHSIVKSSGHRLLDDEVAALLQRASPMPVPPPELARERLEIVAPVSFRLRN